ncbi:MAG: DnaA N-terminal domain-containing protein [Solirubrobacteraceae bacterium]
MFVKETYRTDRGRLRRRRVAIDVEATCAGYTMPALADAVDWKRIREALAARVGQCTFEIWLDPLSLGAVDPSGALVLDAPHATRSWLRHRFAPVLEQAAAALGREVLVADEAQSRSMEALGFETVGVMARRSAAAPSDVSSDSSADPSYSSSACSLSYTSAYTQPKEVGR